MSADRSLMESSGSKSNKSDKTVDRAEKRSSRLEHKVCLRMELGGAIGKKDSGNGMAKEQALCANLTKGTLEFQNKFDAKKGADVSYGKRTCGPVQGGAYYTVEPEADLSASEEASPASSDVSLSFKAAVDTNMATIGSPSVIGGLETSINGEFKSFKLGLDWGCKGTRLEVEKSMGVKIDAKSSPSTKEKPQIP